jgi:hypothetical protein
VKNSAASPTDMAATSAMLRPAIVTARLSGRRRAPLQVGQGTSRM